MRLLISACLLGCRCRYDGASKAHPLAAALAERHDLVPVCPEQLGGLATPRPPAERRGEAVVTAAGLDVTEQYRRGAEEALTLSDKVLIVNEGRISQYGRPEEIIGTPGNEFVREFILNQLVIKRNNIFTLFGQDAGAQMEMRVG